MIEIIITPIGCGQFKARLGGRLVLESSAQPLLDAARLLADLGVPPDTRIGLRHVGASHIALSSTVGAAAGWTTEDGPSGAPRFRRRRARRVWGVSPPMRFGAEAAPTLAPEPGALSTEAVP